MGRIVHSQGMGRKRMRLSVRRKRDKDRMGSVWLQPLLKPQTSSTVWTELHREKKVLRQLFFPCSTPPICLWPMTSRPCYSGPLQPKIPGAMPHHCSFVPLWASPCSPNLRVIQTPMEISSGWTPGAIYHGASEARNPQRRDP